MTSSQQMPRRKVTYRLDDRILDELEKLVTDGSVNQFVEGVLFEFLKNTGRLSITAQRLPDNRGGRRDGAGKKPSQLVETVADPIED